MAPAPVVKTTAPARKASSPPAHGHDWFWSFILRCSLGLLLLTSRSNLTHAQETNATATDDLPDRAWSQAGSNHLETAETLFLQSLRSETNDPEIFHGLATNFYRAQKYALAASSYEQMLRLEPRTTNALFGLGMCYYRLKDYEKAVETYQKYVLLVPGSTNGYYRLYWSLVRQKKYEAAMVPIRQAIALSPANADYYAQLGYCLDELDRYQEALQPLNRALAIDPNYAGARSALNYCYYNLKAYPQAIASLNRMLSQNPANASARYLLGMCYYQLESYPAVVTNLQQYVLLRPTNFSGYFWLARSLGSLHRFDEAATNFQFALQINPRDFEANSERGLMLLMAGRYEEAIPNFETAHALKQNDRATQSSLLLLYILSGEYQKAYVTCPGLCSIGGGLLLLAYLIALTALMRFSFKPRPNAFPGFWFSLAWVAIFFDGQIACLGLLALLSLVKITVSPLATMILAGIPVLVTAARGFARQPWGEPFVWPPRLGPPKLIWLSLLALVLLLAIDSGYSALYAHLTHQPAPLQSIIPMVRQSLNASPVAACLAIVVVAPMVEEILYRGLLFGALQKRLSASVAMIISALIFAVSHLQMAYFIPLFCMGIILAWLRAKSGSLGLSMLVHGLNNGLSLVFIKLFENSN